MAGVSGAFVACGLLSLKLSGPLRGVWLISDEELDERKERELCTPGT